MRYTTLTGNIFEHNKLFYIYASTKLAGQH